MCELLRRKEWSDEDKQVLEWLEKPDDPLRPKDLQLKYFSGLNAAIEARRSVFLKYAGRKGLTSRTVLPERLFRRGEYIYLEAFCLKRRQHRRFRLDRIEYLREDLRVSD
jgi:predicted DNA-binding transcriptional regulator YafY